MAAGAITVAARIGGVALGATARRDVLIARAAGGLGEKSAPEGFESGAKHACGSSKRWGY